jgi:hypothetical protein
MPGLIIGRKSFFVVDVVFLLRQRKQCEYRNQIVDENPQQESNGDRNGEIVGQAIRRLSHRQDHGP